MAKQPTKKGKIAPEDKKLTDLEEKFVRNFLIKPVAAEAWRLAGGAAAASRQVAHEVRNRPHVAKAIKQGQDELAARFKVTESRVLQELAYLAFSDPRDAFDETGNLLRPDEWSSETAAAIASVEVVTTSAGEGAVEHVAKIKRWDKVQALEKLSKHLGIYAPEKTEVTINEIRRTVVDPKE